MISALAIGHVTHDRYNKEIVPGGCAFYGARTFAGLGCNAHLLGAVGTDFQCRDQLGNLELALEMSGKTTNFTNIYPQGSSRVQVIEAVAPRIEPRGLPGDWKSFDVVFYAPVFGELELADWLGRVHGKLVGCGLQGFMKQAGGPIAVGRGTGAAKEESDPKRVIAKTLVVNQKLLRNIDALFLSEEDIRELGTIHLLTELLETGGLTVVTHGGEGCTLHLGGDTARLGVLETRCVDPTGAGDTFAAALLTGLAMGMTVVEAGQLGTAAASVVIEGRGGKELLRVGEAFSKASLVPVIQDGIGNSRLSDA